jgi:hypothetical protein
MLSVTKRFHVFLMHEVEGDIVSVSVLTDVALLNFDLSRLVIFSPKITGKDTRPAVP